MWLAVALLLTAPAEPSPQVKAALALEEQGRDDDALILLRQQVLGAPRSAPPRLELGRMELKLGRDLDDAQLNLDAARLLAPEDARAHYWWALLLEERGKSSQAIEELKVALILQPDFTDAHFRLAGLLAASGDWLQAEAHYQAVVRADPKSISARLQLIEVLRREGRGHDAEVELVGLHQEQPGSVVVTRKLAELYDQTQRPKLAAPLWVSLGQSSPKRPLRQLKHSKH